MKWLLYYLILINIIGFFLIKRDKRNARRGNWRLPEKRIWLISIIGGSIGIYISMKKYRHKTKHRNFMIGIPLIILIQIFLFFVFYKPFIL